jgi:hypothetical protein
VPEVYVAKWVDYSQKYGYACQLTTGSMGVIFNDGDRMHASSSMLKFLFMRTRKDGKEL